METVLHGLIGKMCLVYLDDVVGSTVEELLQRLSIVFEKLRGIGLKISPKKCQLFQKEVRHLGFQILEKGLAADPEKTNAIATWPVPKDAHEVRSFLGLCSYYRWFVKGFAQITKTLNQLTEFQTALQWTNECQKAFEDLKKKLCNPLILAFPDPKKQFILDTDASQEAIESALS